MVHALDKNARNTVQKYMHINFKKPFQVLDKTFKARGLFDSSTFVYAHVAYSFK